MNPIIHFLGLDVHKHSIAASTAPQNSPEVRRYGIIGGTLDSVDKLVRKLAADNSSCAWPMKPARAASLSAANCATARNRLLTFRGCKNG